MRSPGRPDNLSEYPMRETVFKIDLQLQINFFSLIELLLRRNSNKIRL